MIIKSLRVRRYRSIFDETLHCESLTTLVGPNGCGKSSFLRALDLFYSPSPIITRDDFYNRDTNSDIEIGLTFTHLTPEETERFKSRISGNELLVVRVFTGAGGRESGKYYGFRMQNPDFEHLRAKSGREFLNLYRELRESGKYDLPSARSQADAEAALAAWEEAHPERLKLGRDDGQFIGFTNVARGYLGDSTRFLFIPAVRDAAEDVQEGRSSAITALMDLVVRAALSNRKEIAALKDEVQQRYSELTDPRSLPELGSLETSLTDTLKQYYRDAGVSLKWLPVDEIDLPTPQADVRLVDDNFEVPVTKTGHGLQRAFILTLLQHLAVARASRAEHEEEDQGGQLHEAATPKLNLILGIEEPELYQHPSRQRHFARVLYDLAHGKIPGVASKTQIIYATHSALLVGIDRFNQVRRLKRSSPNPSAPKVTSVIGTTWDKVAHRIWLADGSPEVRYTGESIKPRVTTIMTPWMNEGFFAEVAVLVEGEDDRAAILGAAQALGLDLESDGCTVIPCNGKTNLDRPTSIFRELEIPTYVIWDSDRDKFTKQADKENCIKENHRLLRIHGAAVEDWPEAISDSYACFRVDLETTMRAELGAALFDELLSAQQEKFHIRKQSQARKNPVVIAEILKEAATRGSRSPTLKAIVEKIVALRATGVGRSQIAESAAD